MLRKNWNQQHFWSSGQKYCFLDLLWFNSNISSCDTFFYSLKYFLLILITTIWISKSIYSILSHSFHWISFLSYFFSHEDHKCLILHPQNSFSHSLWACRKLYSEYLFPTQIKPHLHILLIYKFLHPYFRLSSYILLYLLFSSTFQIEFYFKLFNFLNIHHLYKLLHFYPLPNLLTPTFPTLPFSKKLFPVFSNSSHLRLIKLILH